MEQEDTSDKSFNKNSPFVFDCIAPDDVTFDLGSQFLLFKKSKKKNWIFLLASFRDLLFQHQTGQIKYIFVTRF